MWAYDYRAWNRLAVSRGSVKGESSFVPSTEVFGTSYPVFDMVGRTVNWSTSWTASASNSGTVYGGPS